MKICLIGTVASSTLNFRKSLIQLMVAEGHEVYVFATDYTEETTNSIKTLGGIPVEYSLNRGGLNPFTDIKNTIQLKRILENIEPDIVFSYFSKPVIFGTIAAKLAKIPRIVGMLEGLGFPFTKISITKKESLKKKIIRKIQIELYRISFRYLDRIIFLNPDDYLDLSKSNNIKHSSHSILGGIGVDTNYFSQIKPQTDPIRFIFIGRLLKEKGIYEYIEAAKIVKSNYPDVEFIVLGNIDAENPSALSQVQLDSLLADATIIHPGHVNDVKEWLHQSSVFVLPSYREGVPCSTQEALACGLPVITTDVPGCRETVIHKENGFIIPPFSSVELVKAMLYFIENKDSINLMGKKSRIIAESKFNENIQNKKLFELIIQ